MVVFGWLRVPSEPGFGLRGWRASSAAIKPSLGSAASAAQVPSLSINPALPDRVCHTINCQHIRGNAVIHAVRLRVAHHIVE